MIAFDINPDNNDKSIAPLNISVPQDDYSIAFVQSPERVSENTEFTVTVAYRNDSYFCGEIPVEILYNGQIISKHITFTGVPFESIVETYTINSGISGDSKEIEARINWINKADEYNPKNNTQFIFITVSNTDS